METIKLSERHLINKERIMSRAIKWWYGKYIKSNEFDNQIFVNGQAAIIKQK